MSLIPRRKPRTARIGVFGVGFHAHWPQFDGLRDELLGKLAVFVTKVQSQGVEAIDVGMIDDAESAYALLPRLKAADLDLVFCDMLTYATSATFGVLIRGLDVPVVLVALHDLKRARIGHFGHPIEHMLDMQTDQTALTAAFGCHVVQTEADDLLRHAKEVTNEEVRAKQDQILDLFDTPDPVSDPLTTRLTDDELQTAAEVAVALDRFVDERNQATAACTASITSGPSWLMPIRNRTMPTESPPLREANS